MKVHLMERIDKALNWPIDTIVRHFQHRLFELAMAVIFLAVGGLLMFSPRSLEVSSMRYLLQTLSVETCIVLFVLFGVARIVALALNGHWMPWGAYVRAAGCVIGAFMWGQWCASLFQLHIVTGKPISPGVPVYAILSAVEAIAFYMALRGARHGRAVQMGHRHDLEVATHSRAEFAGRPDSRAHRAWSVAQGSPLQG